MSRCFFLREPVAGWAIRKREPPFAVTADNLSAP